MSRIGKKPIEIPTNVEVEIIKNKVIVKGPKGKLEEIVHDKIGVEEKKENDKNFLIVSPKVEKDRSSKALWGLSRSLLFNMVKGVTEGYEKRLEVNGVGYKVASEKNKIILNVGYSHPVEFILPENVEVKVEKNVIILSSLNKQLVGQVAANIRKIRKPEPYKGKGIKYFDEVIKRKSGKAAKGGEK
ncbi:50S ribosomal protein L6 [Patescibacteria group bacterium]